MSSINVRKSLWEIEKKDFPKDKNIEEKIKFLLEYAILAPSSHNTQPWLFDIRDNVLDLIVDEDGWLKIADKDKRELHISIGCAVENFIIAAEHFDFSVSLKYFPLDDENIAARMELRNGTARPRYPELFKVITERTTNHNQYDGKRIEKEKLEKLRSYCAKEDVLLHLTGDTDIKKKVDDLISEADATQFSDPEYRKELGEWLGKGVFGTPWLISKIAQLSVTYINLSKGQSKKNSELLMSSPVLGVLSSRNNKRSTQIKVGRVFERIFLAATSLGISLHPMNQILEIAEIKEKVADLIPESDIIPQQTFRLGYASPEKEHTPRKQLKEFLISKNEMR